MITDNIYRIIDTVRFNYSDQYWNLFSDNSGVDCCAINLELKSINKDLYSVESVPVAANEKIFRIFNSTLSVNEDFTNGTIISDSDNIQGIYGCAMVCIYGNLIKKNTLVMHSSLVNYHGRGIVFTGPSGAGKTTQAKLWAEHAGAEIINGDMVFFHREADGLFYACGSPWHGSSEYCVNKKIPVEAVFCIEKSNTCHVKEINASEKITRVFNEVMLPDWFDGCKCSGLNTLDVLLKEVPVLKLECTKDINAVKTVEKMLNL